MEGGTYAQSPLWMSADDTDSIGDNDFPPPLSLERGDHEPHPQNESQSFEDSTVSHYENYDTIDWIRDAMLDRRQRISFDKQTSGRCLLVQRIVYRLQVWILITLVALSSALLAGLISVGVEFLGDLRFGFCKSGFHISKSLCCPRDKVSCPKWTTWGDALGLGGTGGVAINYILYIIFAILFTGLAAWFVKRFANFAAGSGIPEVKTILGGFVIKSFATPTTLLVKCIGLILAVSAGLNAGKEGPMVHVACCCGEIVSKLFPKYHYNEGKKREILSAAAAAGVAVAFGAPTGGVLFSLEEVSYYFPAKVLWRTFFCANIAALGLSILNPLHNGKLVLFQVSYDRAWHYYELIPFIIIAMLGGLIGSFFIKMNTKMCYFRKHSKLRQYPISEAMTVAGITAIVSYLNPYLSGNTGETIGVLFGECLSTDQSQLCEDSQATQNIQDLLAAAAIRLFLVIFTFGLRVPSGIFIPGIAIGASLGRAAGIIMVLLQKQNEGHWSVFATCTSNECITPGVYAMVGAIAVLSGITRMTVSLVVIVFELTGKLDYILPTNIKSKSKKKRKRYIK
eukprot:Phypoly_transcript_03190.p1 GENE.Phypoly_transcript_03190~~Phypoly_transcript_03190.p1  ORF type:complete len:664 (+),score=72.92 Phypoly_transcript_03190:292-1992(+)